MKESAVIKKILELRGMPTFDKLVSEPRTMDLGDGVLKQVSVLVPSVTPGHSLMTDYQESKCYVCSRSWRGDVRGACYGSTCNFRGTMPGYNGLVATTALYEFCNERKVNEAVSRLDAMEWIRHSGRDPYSFDIIEVYNNSRCIVGGRSYMCGAQGRQSPPRYKIHDGTREFGCCGFCRFRVEGTPGITTSDDPIPSRRHYFVLPANEIEEIMHIREVPTIFKKRAVFGIPDARATYEKILYLMSATGHETEVLGRHIVNRSERSGIPAPVFNNQEMMSFKRESVVSPRRLATVADLQQLDGFGTGTCYITDEAKDNLEPLLKHLGPNSMVVSEKVDSIDLNSDEYLATRFVIEQKDGKATYRSVTCDAVIGMLARTNMLSLRVRAEFIEQCYQFLRNWRCMLFECQEGNGGNTSLTGYVADDSGTLYLKQGVAPLTYRTVRTKAELFKENFIGVDVPASYVETPFFMQRTRVELHDAGRGDSSRGELEYSKLSRMYVEREGPFKSFLLDTDNGKASREKKPKLRWKRNMWVSTLFTKRHYTTMPTGIGGNGNINSIGIITYKYIAHNTLDIMRVASYASGSSWTPSGENDSTLYQPRSGGGGRSPGKGR